MEIPVRSKGFTAILHCNKTLRRIPPPLLDGTGTKRNILSFAHAGILHSSMTEDFSEFSVDLPCEKKKECEQEGLNSGPYPVVYPETTVTLHESSKYEILSHSCRKHFRHGGM